MEAIIQKLRSELRIASQAAENLKNPSTLTTPAVRRVGRQNYHLIKNYSKGQIFNLCEALLDSGDWQERLIAFQWAFRIRKQYQSHDYHRFEMWLGRYVTGWGSCDDFCTHAFGYLVSACPEVIPNIHPWTGSSNPWVRRGTAVVLIYGIRRGQFFKAGFEIAEQLLMDSEGLVQKGYGWMLKEISNLDPYPVFEFVMNRKEQMPRIAFRYAIEKMEPGLRAQAMQK